MRRLRALVLPVFLLLFFLILAWLFSRGVLPDPVLYLQADLAALMVLAGLILLVLASARLALHGWIGRIRRQVQDQATEEHRRFLRQLDHELKNPLTAIRVGLANLAEAPSEEERREALASVKAQVQRVSRLAADLRKLAELGTRPLERASVDVGDLLQEVLASAREQPEAEGRDLTLNLTEVPWRLPAVAGDRDLLFLAIYNLLDNALKFTEPGGKVEARAFEDGGTVILEVADQGPGIPEDERSHVWEELYRGQGARGIEGSGLGLSLVRAIIERHGGQVDLRSQLGQGTVVRVRLPTR